MNARISNKCPAGARSEHPKDWVEIGVGAACSYPCQSGEKNLIGIALELYLFSEAVCPSSEATGPLRGPPVWPGVYVLLYGFNNRPMMVGLMRRTPQRETNSEN